MWNVLKSEMLLKYYMQKIFQFDNWYPPFLIKIPF